MKHGIRLAGMTAFGPTHSEEDLWAITALVRELPQLSPEQYQRLIPTAGGGPGHTH